MCCFINLIKLTMNYMDIKNPEYSVQIIPHAIYNTHKNTRIQIQTQRQQAQHTISQLEREAKRSAKELQMKQKTLMNYYKLKESRFQQSLKNQQLRKKREQELQSQRKKNNQLRQNSHAKKSLNRENLMKTNHQSFFEIKRERSETQRKLSQQKELVNQLLKKRNSAFSKAVSLGIEHSKFKSLFHKRAQSSEVNKDLISVEERIKSRQMNTLDHLNPKEKELMELIQRNKKQKEQYDSTFEKFQSLPFHQIYPVLKKQASRRSGSRRSSIKSQSLYVL